MSKPFTSFIVAGGTGHLGKQIVQALSSHGFRVTVFRRKGSQSQQQQQIDDNHSIKEEHVDYNDTKALASSMLGHQVVIDALSIMRMFSPDGKQHSKNLAIAAKQAGVQLFVPNDFGLDHEQTQKVNDPPLPPIHQGHPEFRTWLKEEVGLDYLSFSNGMFADRRSFLNISFADEATKTARLVGGGIHPFRMTHPKDIADFVGKTFANLSREELINKELHCVGAKISWKDLFEQADKKQNAKEKWKIETIPIEQAKEVINSPPNPKNPMESMVLSVQLAQFNEERLLLQYNDNQKVGFTPSINPVDVFLGND